MTEPTPPAELAASEARWRTLVTGMPQLVWCADAPAAWSWASPQWAAFTGQAVEDSLGYGWLEAVHPDDRGVARQRWAEAESDGIFEADYRILDAASGRHRWFQTRALPVRDDHGAIDEWLGTSTDVEDLHALQQRQQLLVAELQHRVRNTLGIIKSITRRTAQSSQTVEDMAAHLDGRIEAFSRVQSVVTRDPGAGVSLLALVEEELLAHATREGRQLSIRGDALMLSPRAAESFSLGIHELTTNAVKHGALSARHGRVDVRWRVDGEQLLFEWSEAGLDAPLKDPDGDGFGMELLVESLPYDLDAETRLNFAPDGLQFTLRAPVKNLLAQPFSEHDKDLFTGT